MSRAPQVASFLLVFLVLGFLRTASASAGAAGFMPGETFTFNVSIGQIDAGRARMAIGAPVARGDRRLVAVQGQAETSPWVNIIAHVNDYYKMVFDVASLLPESILSVERGTHERRISTVASKQTVTVEVTMKGQTRRVRRTLPRPARDAFSALFAIRSLPLGVGDGLELDILEGAILWRTKLKVTQKEILQPEHGLVGAPRPAWRFEGECRRIDDLGRPNGRAVRHFGFWISDDQDRLLLRAWFESDLGRAALDLTSYDRPASPKEMHLDREVVLPGIIVTPAAR
jgi:hypothetical protein